MMQRPFLIQSREARCLEAKIALSNIVNVTAAQTDVFQLTCAECVQRLACLARVIPCGDSSEEVNQRGETAARDGCGACVVDNSHDRIPLVRTAFGAGQCCVLSLI